MVVAGFIAFGALTCLYALASVIAFNVLGGFLTYSLLHLVGNVRMLGSSVTAYLTPRVVLGLIAVPAAYVALVIATARCAGTPRRRRAAVAWAVLAVWAGAGHYVFATNWFMRGDWRIAENAPWVLVSSWWRAMNGGETVKLSGAFGAADLADFEPSAPRPPQAVPRPPNVILIVLEAVAVRWTSTAGGLYDTTPNLKAESAHALVFDNFYAHIGRSSNALAAMLLSVYPKLDFLDFTEEYPRARQTSLVTLFRDRGYRTAFVTPSDLTWAGWQEFIQSRGFDEIRDVNTLGCGEPISSWGLEDRCMVDAIIQYIGEPRTKQDESQIPNPESRPFFVMAWTQQTHHPYEPSPDVPMLDLLREHGPDDYELERYLNVLHETDRHLERLFEAVRGAGLADDTLIVVVGDHGQAFGYPHDSYTQGRTVYEEDVHVPLLLWWPGRYKTATSSPVVGGQVDLAPTIAELAGIPAARDWQGRSLFDPSHPPRAYFYVAQNEFKLGVREDQWKYIFDLRAGAEELYDLTSDPNEQHNLAKSQPDRCVRLRQHLAAWTEANRRQYANFGKR